MGISVTFYCNNKRINSTKVPTAQAGDFGVTVELKDVTNLYTPSIVLSTDRFKNGEKITNPMQYNYCYIADFARYYFVKSWSWVLGRWECALEIDVLASFKTEIGNATAYVLRSASNYNNLIIDTKYPMLSNMERASTIKNSRWLTDIDTASVANGFFVIGVINNDVNAIGVTSYYALSGRGMREFISKLYASPAWMNITDSSISTDLQKMLMNPIQYITSCMWFPFAGKPTEWVQRGGVIPVGWWSISMTNTVYWLTGNDLTITQYETFELPVHPQAGTRYKWLRNAPYSQYQLQFYPYGVFPIDSAKLINYDAIRCRMDIDLMTGSSILTVTRMYDGTDYYDAVLVSTSVMIGIPISLAQMSVDMSRLTNGFTITAAAGLALAGNNFLENASNAIDSFIEKAGDAISDFGSTPLLSKPKYNMQALSPSQRAEIGSGWANDEQYSNIVGKGASLIGSVKSVARDIGNAVMAASGVCKVSGTNGTLAQYKLYHILNCYYYRIADTDIEHYGSPLCRNVKLNTLSGFILCANEGDLSVSATPAERQAITAFMEAGFYYE